MEGGAASFSPRAAVQVAVADGFCDVGRLYRCRARQIGDGARHLQYTAVGAGREVEAVHRAAEQPGGGFVQRAVLLQMP